MATLAIFTVKIFYRHEGAYYTNGGFGLYLEQMCQNFDRVALLCFLKKGAPPQGFYRVEHPNLEVITVPSWPTEAGAVAAQPLVFFKGLMLMHRVDAVHARMPDWTGLTGALVARLTGTPCFHQIIDDWHGQAMRTPLTKTYGLGAALRALLLFYDWFERRLSRGQLVFAQGQVSYDKHAGAAERFLVLSSAHHLRDIGSVLPKCQGEQIILLSVGRLVTVKNHEMLIRSMVDIRKAEPRACLRIVGEGHKRAGLEALVCELGLQDAVHLPGSVKHDELWEEYDSADLFVLPSISEGTPKVVLEAMARGCPVVASNVGGVSSAVEHGERGLLFEVDDRAGMTDLVLQLLSDSELRRRCQDNALAFSRRHTLEESTHFMLSQVARKWPSLVPFKAEANE
jgi:glycosyltransferase involved in cell wall biosynthesis